MFKFYSLIVVAGLVSSCSYFKQCPCKNKKSDSTGIVILSGPPLSGKGFLSEKLVASGKFQHLSVGDLLRKSASSVPGVAEAMRSGKLVDSNIVNGLVKDELIKYKNNPGGKILLFDGYPRSEFDASTLDTMLNETGLNIKAVIQIECSDDILYSRLENRAKKEKRADDNMETAKKRVAFYKETSAKVIARYGDKIKNISCKSSDIHEQAVKELGL